MPSVILNPGKFACIWNYCIMDLNQKYHSLHVCALLLQPCLTLCDPVDCSLTGSSVHGILQVRTLEWAAMPSSRVSFLTQGSNLGLRSYWLKGSESCALN